MSSLVPEKGEKHERLIDRRDGGDRKDTPAGVALDFQSQSCSRIHVDMCVEVCLQHSHAIVRRVPLVRNSLSDKPHIA